MRKMLVIIYILFSFVFFTSSVKQVYSIAVSQPGDMVSCSSNFKYCTDGGCIQSDRTFAIRCKIKNCANGCKEFKQGRCVKWNYWKIALTCTGGELPGHGGNMMCDPLILISTGICLPINLK